MDRLRDAVEGSTAADGSPTAPDVAQPAIYRCLDEAAELLNSTGLNDEERAARADRLAQLAELRGSWWAGLARWALLPGGDVPLIFALATEIAHREADSDARFWRETAQFWRDRATNRDADDDDGICQECA